MPPQLFSISPFWPVAIGFFGLGTGSIIWGGTDLFGVPKESPEVNRTMGMWGVWLPGFCQVLAGIYLMVGLTWFNVFRNSPSLYMAALAFTVFGSHWFAMAHRRYIGADPTPQGWMAIAFLIVSTLGAYVFFGAGDVPVAIVFIGLALSYATEIPTQLVGWTAGKRLGALWQFLTGIWLMYITWAITCNFALGDKFWV